MAEPVKVINERKRSGIKSAISYSGNVPGISASNTFTHTCPYLPRQPWISPEALPVEADTLEVLGLGDFRLQFSKLFGSGLSRWVLRFRTHRLAKLHVLTTHYQFVMTFVTFFADVRHVPVSFYPYQEIIGLKLSFERVMYFTRFERWIW